MTIKIAHLYYDLMNLYGESANIRAITKYLDCNKIKYKVDLLTINDKIDFKKYDLYYMGMGTERSLELVLNDIMKYKEDIKKAIQDKKHFILTGNSTELFGKYIIKNDEDKLKALSIFPYYSKRINEKNYSDQCSYRMIGTIVGTTSLIKEKIIGFQNQGYEIYNSKSPFLKITKGTGNNKQESIEGFKKNNCICTSLIGPLLIRNPYLTKYILDDIIKSKDNKFKIKENILDKEIKAYNKFFVNEIE